MMVMGTTNEWNSDTGPRLAASTTSACSPITEPSVSVNMMTGQRAFDANAKMITYQDQTLQQANGIGRIA